MGESDSHHINIELREMTQQDKDDYEYGKYQYMEKLETKINNDIGFRFWSKYVSSAFWSNISLPINLSITMMTALSTGQATTENLLPKGLYVNISIATLVISVLNTYFRPHVQMNKNLEMMNKWNVLGCEFETIYYSEKKTLVDYERRIREYEEFMKKVNDLKKTENLETQNFFTDVIYTILRSGNCFLKHNNSWLALDENLKRDNDAGRTFPPTPPPRAPSPHFDFTFYGKPNVSPVEHDLSK